MFRTHNALAGFAVALLAFVLAFMPLCALADGFLQQGDGLTFGSYQGEAIQWRVLAVEDDRALVISKDILDAKPYNATDGEVTWEASTLRGWLNDDFFSVAFTPAEQERIAQIVVVNGDNPLFGTPGCDATQDKVFLLSIEEVFAYFLDPNDAQAVPTAYAVQQGAFVWMLNGAGWWWLRSPGRVDTYAAMVRSSGIVSDSGDYVCSNDGGVRPALWLSLEESVFEGDAAGAGNDCEARGVVIE